ncbi:MAG: hypothetical protein K6U12_05205 [Armatimonadetes bacterium]|nr:hypothetical protein [Armatimonadota bacterium]CUU38367.1 hypothetical protein DCOP10_12570 [Armatimonadetes bacterium DC]
MNRQVLRLKWLVGVLAASVALLAGWLFSAESPQTPPADFQKLSQHNVLFVIPYGNAENQIYLSSGAIDAALSETFRRQLYSLLEERDDIELFGTKVEVDAQGTVYLPMLLRLREGEDYERTLLAKLSPRGTMELVDDPPGRAVRSHDGSVVYVKFQPLEDADPRDYSWLSAYIFMRADGTEVARFRVPPCANENSLITREPVLVRPDRLAIVSFEKVAPDKPNRARSLPHFCHGYKRLMVVTPEGKIVYEDWVQGPPMTEAWCVTDGRGNLYYLNFTDAGVEVKKVRVP